MIILASRSPQRRALLSALQLPFRVVSSHFHEAGHDRERSPADVVTANALGKAREVAQRTGIPDSGAVVGADTGVVASGRLLGKPADAEEAAEMLATLAGRDHEVVTAVSVIAEAGERSAQERTTVRMRPLLADARAWYVATGEWHGRAGGYAIQGAGAAVVERIEGDYTNVVGLPLARLVAMLEELGLAPWAARGSR